MKRIRRILATAMSFMMCLTLLSNTAFAQGVTPLIDSSDDGVYVYDIDGKDLIDGVELSVDENEIAPEDIVIENEQDESIPDESSFNDDIVDGETDVDDASDDFDVEDVQNAYDSDNEVGSEESDIVEDTISSDETEENANSGELSSDTGEGEDIPVVIDDDDSDSVKSDDVENEIVEETEDEIPSEIIQTIENSSEESSNTYENDSFDSDFLWEEYIDRENVDEKKASGIDYYSELVTALSNASTDENNPTTIVLGDDIVATSTLTVDASRYVVLDLNGHILTGNGRNRVIDVDGNLTIIDSNPDATHTPEITYTSPVDDTTTYTINGGIIKGGKGEKGGALYVYSTGSLTLNGGSLALNYVSGDGGAVYTKSGSSFIMNGGNICGNESGCDGGGIYINGGSFVMNDGSISGNHTDMHGGGVYVYNSGSFVMNAGIITDNFADYGEGCGGGVYIRMSSDFRFNGGTISFNKAAAGGGLGLYESASATMTGGKICNNLATWTRSGGGGVNVDESDSFTMTGGEISDNETKADGGGLRLNGVSFNMSGDAVIKDNKAAGEGGGIYIKQKTATITMSGNALIKDNEAISNGGGIKNGTITMEDNTGIDGNVSGASGGGISTSYAVSLSDNAYVNNNVCNGNGKGYGGGGIYVNTDASTINISDNVSISNNSSNGDPGSYWAGGGGIYCEGTITMTSGKIENNYSNADGGGIALYYKGTLVISGGTITSNKAKRLGGAVHDDGDNGTHIELSGNPVIFNNTIGDDTVGNIRYYHENLIQMVGPLTDGAKIGFTVYKKPTQATPSNITEGYSAYNTEDPSIFFVSDEGYYVYADDNGDVKAATSWQIFANQLSKGGTFKLNQDIKATPDDGSITIGDNIDVTLDLNGHIIDGCGYPGNILNLYRNDNVNFTIIDSNPNAEHTPAVTYTDPVTNETVTVKGGIMKGASSRGISINGGSTVLTMKGGSLMGNNGGVYLVNSTFNLEGGSICGNICSGDGGGVWPYYGGTFNMSGGSICGNTAAGEGGGVYLWENQSSHSSMYLSGGTVKNNVSVGTGGGIKVANRGHLYVSGNPQVYNNKKGDELNNIISVNAGIFNINGEITSGAKIEVTGVPSLGSWNKLTSGFSTYNPDSNPADYFFPADEGAFISLYDGEATLYANNLITFDANGGTGEMPTLTNIGGLYTLPENAFTPARGKKFRKWKIGNREYAPGTQYNICDNTNIIAMWDNLPLYTITFNVNGGNDLDTATYTLYDGEEYGEMAVPNWPGYVFDGWFTDATAGDRILSTDVCNGNITLYAHWSLDQNIQYTVEHYKQNIDGSYTDAYETVSFTGEAFSNVTPDVKTYEGFTAPAKQTVEIKADGSTAVRYEYTRNSYAITWNFNGGSASGDYTTGNVLYEAPITAPTPTNKGYTFNGWNATVPSNMPASELAFTAKWIARTDTAYKVEHYKQGLDGKYTAKPAVEKLKGTTGASIKPAVKKYEGFKSPSVQKATIEADGSLVVKYYYTRNSYTLKWDYAGGSASGSFTSGKVKFGTKITAPKPTKKGYTFNGWSSSVAKTMPAKNVTYKAKWKANSYTLTWDLAGGTASNKYTSGKVNYNAGIVAPVPTKEGYTFDGWSVSVPSKMPAKNLKITAKWREKTQEEYVTDFVKRFYSVVLERPQAEIDADVDGIKYWVDRLISGVDDGSNVAYGFVYSKEFQNKGVSDEEYVIILYHSFFGRDPFDPNNLDTDGYNYWLNKLKTGTDRMDVLAGFTNSAEFQNLCNKYNIKRGTLVPSEKPSYRKAHNLP